MYRVVGLPEFFVLLAKANKRREVKRMDTYQILTLLFLGGTFLVALLAYLDNRDNKPKK